MQAADEGSNESLELLLDCRADVDAKNRAGETALMIARRKGRAGTVRLLLGAGAKEQ
jgi:ankyrin repeat protein